MVKVSIDGVTLAQSNNTVVVEGNHYFNPASLLDKGLFTPSTTTSVCPWKGNASYYNLTLPDGRVIPDIAWYYPEPKEAARNIEGYLAFYKNKVTIEN